MTSELVQGTDAWKIARCGHVTASRVSDVIARTKTGPAAVRTNYLAELICERLTGVPAESYVNAAMQHGIATEPDAREAYEFHTLSVVDLVGFVRHPHIEGAGASPDGYVGEDGLIEIKCPQSPAHIDTLLSQSVPSKYITQMQFQMACTGRSWCDYVSFDPRMPASMQLFVKRVNRDHAMIDELEFAVLDFLSELAQKVAALTKIYQRDAA